MPLYGTVTEINLSIISEIMILLFERYCKYEIQLFEYRISNKEFRMTKCGIAALQASPTAMPRQAIF